MEQQVSSSWLTRFLYAAGKTGIPFQYLQFTGISVMAAALANRVSLSLYQGSRLYPNLITMLVGPSGVGKGRAINYGIGLLEEAGLGRAVGLFGGSLTSAALVDFLASEDGKLGDGRSRAYFISPELASSIKWGEHADALIKRMTDFYTGDLREFSDATRMKGGRTTIIEPCVNWLGGSTRMWLLGNLKPDAISGGFMARSFFVEQNEYPRDAPPFPVYPPDALEVREGLKKELGERIIRLSGEFKFTQSGQRLMEEWVTSRPRPQFDDQMPAFQRQRELALKLAMIVSASESSSLLLDYQHVYEGITLTETEKEEEKPLIRFVGSGGKMTDMEYIAERIKKFGEVTRAELTKMATSKGIESIQFQTIIERLKAQEDIEEIYVAPKTAGTKRRTIYRWSKASLSLSDLRREEAI